MVTLLFNIIGSIGLVLLLAGFYIEEANKFKSHKVYSALNLTGSLLLVIYAWELKGWIFVVLNIIWMFVAGWYLVNGSSKHRKKN